MEMVKKKDMTAEKLRKAKADDAVVYKVMVALVLLCSSILVLRSLRNYYETVAGFSALYDLTPWIAVAGAAIAAVSALVMVFWKNKLVRYILCWVLGAGLIVAVTGLSMRMSWVDGFPMLYLLCVGVLVQYIILQLYRWEFFLVSASNVAAGAFFFCCSRGFSWIPQDIAVLAVLATVLAVTAFCACSASRNKGAVVLGKKHWLLFPEKFSPMMLYIADALWLICAAASLLLGGLFGYYCMFAAIAVEFVAAVYYTFQLN